MIDPTAFARGEAWLLFQLNDAPLQTVSDGDFNVPAIMDVATGLILGTEFVAASEVEPTEPEARPLFVSAVSEAGQRPQRLFHGPKPRAGQVLAAARAVQTEVVAESASDLNPIISEARDGFLAHVSGSSRQ